MTRAVAQRQFGVAIRRKNAPPKSMSGYRGVIFRPKLKKKPWLAYIRHHGMFKGLGYYATCMEAVLAYNKEAKRLGAYVNPLPPQA